MTGLNANKSKSEITPKLTRRERKLLKTRQQILDAARELFETLPYEEVTMDDIAELADLSRATLYNHFDVKKNIYFEIGIQSFRDLAEKYKLVIATDSSGLDQIIQLSEEFLRSMFEQPLYHEIMRYFAVTESKAEITADETMKKISLGEVVENSALLISARYWNELHTVEKTWNDAINRGFEDGSIHHDLNVEHLTHFIYMLITGFLDRINLERYVLKRINLSIERIIRLIIDLIRKDLTMD